MSEFDWVKQRDGSFFCGKHGGYFSVKCYPCTIEGDNQTLIEQNTTLRELAGEMVEIMGWTCIECGGQYENGKWYDDEFGPMTIDELCPTCKKRNNLIHRYEQLTKGE